MTWTTDVQTRLATLGFDPGPADGIIGPRTREAIHACQAWHSRVVGSDNVDDLLWPFVADTGDVPDAPRAWPKPDRASMNAFYGDPDPDRNGHVDRAWEDEHLVALAPPYRMVLAWDIDADLRTIRVHDRCAESLYRALDAIGKHYGSQQAIEKARMHLYGGCYNFRLMRGGSSLSKHSWGAAIDLDPERNWYGRKYNEARGMMPMAVVEMFAAEGWKWGGHWKKADAMHLEATS